MLSLHNEIDRQITGGSFFHNRADFGGFMYKSGAGNTSCSGASVTHNRAVDGGGAYLNQNATVEWSCDLTGNRALSGAAM